MIVSSLLLSLSLTFGDDAAEVRTDTDPDPDTDHDLVRCERRNPFISDGTLNDQPTWRASMLTRIDRVNLYRRSMNFSQ
uniref:Putative secreted peptide n=1 Tax=Anopheles braziliensis TaxID=58242 RepID=A0A2M3ZUU4_9DIPT